ncbi:MAG: glycosyltransferase [Rikenellaceae bacterium]|nr:glycosyltransferase [Rikenellaceae bacterium]
MKQPTKGLFLVFHGFAPHNGISKKIHYQRDALLRCGADVGLCYTTIAPDGTQKRMLDDTVIADFGGGKGAKVRKRIDYRAVVSAAREQGVRFVYARHDHNASPVTIGLYRALHRLGIRIALEVPTYPYDPEFAQSPWPRKLKLRIDRLFRRRMARYIDRIVTFTDEPEIFGRPTIRISNGIDFGHIPVKPHRNDTSHELNLIGVADLHFWHGFDRVIEGMAAYEATPHDRKVRFHIVGAGVEAERNRLRELATRYGLTDRVVLYGNRAGTGLDELFDRCDMGIASLGRHRNGITKIKTLKNREYAARGIPFVYSETDDDFDAMPYVLKAPADESPLDIAALVRFYDSADTDPARIRASVEGWLSWEVQMRKVLDELL